MITCNEQRQEHKNLATVQRAKLKGADEFSTSLSFRNLETQLKILKRMDTIVVNGGSSLYDNNWMETNAIIDNAWFYLLELMVPLCTSTFTSKFLMAFLNIHTTIRKTNPHPCMLVPQERPLFTLKKICDVVWRVHLPCRNLNWGHRGITSISKCENLRTQDCWHYLSSYDTNHWMDKGKQKAFCRMSERVAPHGDALCKNGWCTSTILFGNITHLFFVDGWMGWKGLCALTLSYKVSRFLT